MAQDLSQPSRYLQIAQLYDNAGQIEEAIHWAEDGLEAFQDSYTGQLGDFLIAAYEQQGRYEEAIDIVWQTFPAARLFTCTRNCSTRPKKQMPGTTGEKKPWL
jgi:tetratricopeptide (TPR) repeat protein